MVIHSSFRVKMSIWEVTFSPADSRFYYIPTEEFAVALAPYKDTEVGGISMKAINLIFLVLHTSPTIINVDQGQS